MLFGNRLPPTLPLDAYLDVLRGSLEQLANIDFSFQPSIRRAQVESLHELGFVERRENVVLLGPPDSRKGGDVPKL